MKNLLSVLLVLSLLVAIAAATAVGIVLWMSDPADRQVATVLVYEIDRKAEQGGPGPGIHGAIDPSEMAEAIESRLNSRFSQRVANVDVDPQGRITVGIYGNHSQQRARIEYLLSVTGHVEARMLANRVDNEELVERAMKSVDPDVRNAAGDLLARWVPIHPRCQALIPPGHGIIRRNVTDGAARRVEVLVVHDDSVMDHDCLGQAKPGQDHFGRPCVSLEWKPEGTARLSQLVQFGTFNAMRDEPLLLGVLLDGVLCSTANLHDYTVIGERYHNISRTFNDEEVAAIVAALNDGPLPAGLRRVEVRNQAK